MGSFSSGVCPMKWCRRSSSVAHGRWVGFHFNSFHVIHALNHHFKIWQTPQSGRTHSVFRTHSLCQTVSRNWFIEASEAGFWLEDDDKEAFMVVLYEKLPLFCCNCSLVGHIANSYGLRRKVTHGSASFDVRLGNPRSGLIPEVVLPGDPVQGASLDIDD